MHYAQIFCKVLLAFFVSSDRIFIIFGRSTGTPQCPGGYAQGTVVDRGHYWYECRDGQLVPKGCLTDDRRRIDVQQTYDAQNIRLQCVMNSDGYLSFAYKSCVHDNFERSPNERWDDGKYWYECRKDSGGGLRTVIGGCADQGRKLDFGEKVTKGDFVYVCEAGASSSSGQKLSRDGCVFENGRKYGLGDAFEQGDKWYVCTGQGVKCVGCVRNGQRLKNNDRFTLDEIIYECVVRDRDTSVEPYGCVQSTGGATIQRKLGCSWLEGTAPFQYEMTCRKDDSSRKAVKAPARCVYNGSNIEPGCFQFLDKTMVGCLSESNSNNVKTRVFQTTDVDAALASGLRMC